MPRAIGDPLRSISACGHDLRVGNRVGGSLVATITRGSTQLLRLQPGAPVTALIKASWVILAPASRKPLAYTARNLKLYDASHGRRGNTWRSGGE